VITRYLYNGSDPIAEYDGSGALQAKYLHGPGLGEPLAMVRGSNVYWYHGDGLGSVTEVTDGTETLIEQYLYDSFGNLDIYDGSGNPLSQTAIGNPFTYIGQEYDYESGLYYLRARYYSPEQGRFLARDPLEIADDLLSSSSNTYAYAANSPLSQKDPFGLASCDPTSGVIRANERYVPGSSMKVITLKSYVNPGCEKSCCFIQQMQGYIYDMSQTPPQPFRERSYWGQGIQPTSFLAPLWYVDSYKYSAYYPGGWYGTKRPPTTPSGVIQIEDTPSCRPPCRYKMQFKVAVYDCEEQEDWSQPKHHCTPTGQLNIDDPKTGVYTRWDTIFETNSAGQFLCTGGGCHF
jgi:RHS repeat-associated protein